MPKAQKDINRDMRKMAIREQLKEQKHLEKAIDNIKKIETANGDMDVLEFQRLKAATELRLKLVAKYIPDLKSIEHSGEIGVTDNITAEEAKELSFEELRKIAKAKNVVAM